jgi:hypothetical protein
MRLALDPTGHRVPRTKPTCLLHTWRPHRQRPFALVLHLHQHESSRNLHLQYLDKNQSTQRCQSLITQGSDHPPVLEPYMVLSRRWRGAAGANHGFDGGGVHRSGAGAPSSLRQSSLLHAHELPPLRGLPDLTWSAPHSVAAIFASLRPPCSFAPPDHRHTSHCHALLAQLSCHLPSRREGVHLCISSLIGRKFASRFALAIGGGEVKAQLRA